MAHIFKIYEQLPPDSLEQELLNRKQKLEELIAIKKIQKRYPANNGKYLSKSKMDYIKTLAQKDYNLKILPQLEEQLDAVNLVLASLGKTNLSQLYEKYPFQRKCLVEPITLTAKEYNARWQKVEYQPKTFYTDVPELFTAKGERVRSKSEIIIADTLARQEICYRYEFPLDLGNQIVYPDFYCLNTRTRQEFIWEHFGMMDDFDYACSVTKKIKAYQEAGYFLGDNFIITMETADSPINTKQIEEIIEKYLK